MTLTIPDAVLREAGLSEQEAMVEFACRLFDADRLSLFSAAKLAGMSRPRFEDELRERGIAIYRPTVEDLRKDLENLKRMGV